MKKILYIKLKMLVCGMKDTTRYSIVEHFL